MYVYTCVHVLHVCVWIVFQIFFSLSEEQDVSKAACLFLLGPTFSVISVSVMRSRVRGARVYMHS